MVDFPRVLFITPVAFNPFFGGGATFGSLFEGWPKDRLATVHNDQAPSPNDVCANYFALRSEELDFIPPFGLLRRARNTMLAPGSTAASAPSARKWRLTDTIRRVVLGNSIPERARLTAPLERWIADFRPQVIYTILGSNGMMALIEQIRARFDLPLVVHIMDDWAMSAHRSGAFAPIERRRMQGWLRHFFSKAQTCLGISPAMCRAYTERYGRDFVPFQYALNRERWGSVVKSDLLVRGKPELLYVGSIFPNAQLGSLIDCTLAVAAINADGFPLRLRIVTSTENGSRFGHLLTHDASTVLDVSAYDDNAFFHNLADADALLLPVNFDCESVDFIRYSMPTKVPAYLNSGTPVLAYGPAETAQMQYAEKGWALTVTERSPEKLKAAMKRIASDLAMRKSLSRAARAAATNHDARVVRSAFHKILSDAARQSVNLRSKA
jgi:glycosyltransferase involved in cell wall biosynthesis